jgi:hypothetical protein
MKKIHAEYCIRCTVLGRHGSNRLTMTSIHHGATASIIVVHPSSLGNFGPRSHFYTLTTVSGRSWQIAFSCSNSLNRDWLALNSHAIQIALHEYPVKLRPILSSCAITRKHSCIRHRKFVWSRAGFLNICLFWNRLKSCDMYIIDWFYRFRCSSEGKWFCPTIIDSVYTPANTL